MKDNYKTIQYPLSTEKTIRLMESENKLVFVVDRKATKKSITEAFNDVFGTKPVSVNTHIQQKKKIAYVTLPMDMPAIEIATQLGLM